MTDVMNQVVIGVSAFAAGVFCGAALVGPKVYAAVTGALGEMSRDLNPRRHSPAS